VVDRRKRRTDDWDVFAKVFPKDHHVIGKAQTTTITGAMTCSSLNHHSVFFARGVPSGIRTRVAAVRGRLGSLFTITSCGCLA
jgi:hypothetical protein